MAEGREPPAERRAGDEEREQPNATGPARSGSPWRTLRAWLAAIAWGALVWVLGSDSFSAAQTSRWLRPIVEWFGLQLNGREMYDLLLNIRFAAHVVVYGLFALLTFRALWLGTGLALWTNVGLTLLLVSLLAAADEYRQAGSAVRGGEPGDVFLDLSGGVLALTVAGLANLWVSRSRASSAASTGPSTGQGPTTGPHSPAP